MEYRPRAVEGVELMRVLVTGSEGHIGTILCAYPLDRGHDVTGLDTGFHRVGWLCHGVDRSPRWMATDIRQVEAADLAGFGRHRGSRRAVERSRWRAQSRRQVIVSEKDMAWPDITPETHV